MKHIQKPGETPAFTGLYQEVKPDGEKLSDQNVCVINTGDKRLPPTKREDDAWLWITPFISEK